MLNLFPDSWISAGRMVGCPRKKRSPLYLSNKFSRIYRFIYEKQYIYHIEDKYVLNLIQTEDYRARFLVLSTHSGWNLFMFSLF